MTLLASPSAHNAHKLRNDSDMDLRWSAAAENKLIFVNCEEIFLSFVDNFDGKKQLWKARDSH